MATNNYPTRAIVKEYFLLSELLNSIYLEMKEFSKKKPEDLLNEFKVKNVNRVLSQIKTLLNNEPTSQFLEILDNDNLPSNSDAILVIGQFKASMNRFFDKYTIGQKWKTNEEPNGEYIKE